MLRSLDIAHLDVLPLSKALPALVSHRSRMFAWINISYNYLLSTFGLDQDAPSGLLPTGCASICFSSTGV